MNELPDLSASSTLQNLADVLDEVLHLLEVPDTDGDQSAIAEAIHPSLLDQCIDLCQQGEDRKVEPIRTVHHLSCTGGTLITKCLAAMPNVMVLNEVDPLSAMELNSIKPKFTPTDMLALVRQGNHKVSEELLIRLFLQNLESLRSELTLIGKRLLLRDHSHSHFLTGSEVPLRPTVLNIVADCFPTLSIITVRDPIDSFLSLRSQDWGEIFQPFTFDEYCKRYIHFLDAHQDLPTFKYEDLVVNPENVLSAMCKSLDLPYIDNFRDTFNVFKFSGDSGRSGYKIESRPRRQYDEYFLREISSATAYSILHKRLGYPSLLNEQ